MMREKNPVPVRGHEPGGTGDVALQAPALKTGRLTLNKSGQAARLVGVARIDRTVTAEKSEKGLAVRHAAYAFAMVQMPMAMNPQPAT